MILAEGLLCRGLGDDPSAMSSAISLLQRITMDEPSNFFAKVDLADALRRRFPLSDDAEAALRTAHDALSRADIGAAREGLRDYIGENLAAVAEQRARALPLLTAWSDAYVAGNLSPRDMASFVSLLILTGPRGVIQAERRLDAYLERHPDYALATLYRAEVLRQGSDPARSREFYIQAEAQLCHAGPKAPQSPECSLARFRLEHLRLSTELKPSTIPAPPAQSQRRFPL